MNKLYIAYYTDDWAREHDIAHTVVEADLTEGQIKLIESLIDQFYEFNETLEKEMQKKYTGS